MNIGQCSATPFTEDINCYFAHKVISETAIEQLGFAESLMHIVTIPSSQGIIKQIDKHEIIIDDSTYNLAKQLLEYLFAQAKETIANIKAIEKTTPFEGTCFRHGTEIGMIKGRVRSGIKIGFSGLRLKDDRTLNSFLSYVDPDELSGDVYEQIEPHDYAKLEALNNSTFLNVKAIIQNGMKTSEKNFL